MAFRKPFGAGNNSGKQVNDLGSGILGGAGETQDPNASMAQTGNAWTNLQTYLDANKGQGAGIANAVTQKTQENIDVVGKNIQSWGGEAKKRVDDSTRKDTWSEQIKADPTKVDKDAYSAWKNLGNYWGANQAEKDSGYGDVYGKSQKAQEDVKFAGNYDGQKVLANKTFNQGGNYTQGMGLLDTFVMRGDEAGKQALQGFQDKNASFGQKFSDASKDVNTYIGGAGGRGQNAYDQVMNSIGGKRQGITNSGQAAYDQALSNQKATNLTAAKNQLAEGGLEANAEDYLTRNANFDVNDVYSQADIDALNSLAGLDDDFNTEANFLKGTDSAYSYDQNRVAGDVSAFQKAKADKAAAERAAALAAEAAKVTTSEGGGVAQSMGEVADPLTKPATDAVNNNNTKASQGQSQSIIEKARENPIQTILNPASVSSDRFKIKKPKW